LTKDLFCRLNRSIEIDRWRIRIDLNLTISTVPSLVVNTDVVWECDLRHF
jgi:hypothetical protein